MMKTIKKNLNGWKVGLALLISMMTFVFLSCEDQLDNESEFPQEAEIRFKEFNKVHFGETFLIEANEASNEKLSNLEDKYGAPTRVEKFSLATPSGARQFMMLEYKVNTADDKLFTVVEHMPEYPGGFDAMTTFLQENMRYPSEARRKGIEGKVFVGFNVEKNGAVSNVEIMKGLDASCDAEAIRVVREFPKWKPATQKGEVVRVRYVLPINFSLQ